MYYRKHEKTVNSFDENDIIGYVNKNKTRNCTLDAIERYDSNFAHINFRLPHELKERFKIKCKELNTSMNEELCSLILADIESE